MNLLGGLGGPLPWGLLATLPRIVCWIVRLTCLGAMEVRRSPVFWWRQESRRLGGKGGRGCTGMGKTGIFPGRGRLGGKGVRGVLAWERLASSPRRGRVGGKGVKGGTDLGKTGIFPGRGGASLGKSTVFPSLAAGMYGGWRGVSLSVGGPAWEDLLSSLGGTWEITWLLPWEL